MRDKHVRQRWTGFHPDEEDPRDAALSLLCANDWVFLTSGRVGDLRYGPECANWILEVELGDLERALVRCRANGVSKSKRGAGPLRELVREILASQPGLYPDEVIRVLCERHGAEIDVIDGERRLLVPLATPPEGIRLSSAKRTITRVRKETPGTRFVPDAWFTDGAVQAPCFEQSSPRVR